MTTTRKQTQEEYEQRELEQLRADEAKYSAYSLSDRKENEADLIEAINSELSHIDEAIDWIEHGSYGYGAMIKMKQIQDMSKRTNRTALLFQLFALVEFRCPQKHANTAYNKLTPKKQAELNELIKKYIDLKPCGDCGDREKTDDMRDTEDYGLLCNSCHDDHYMTDYQCFSSFLDNYGTLRDLKRAFEDDEIMVSEHWSNYTDMLCKEGKITGEQYHEMESIEYYL